MIDRKESGARTYGAEDRASDGQGPGQHRGGTARVDAAASERVEMAIDELRKRLLDLSLNNQMLKFRLSERARGHIRLVDEVPSMLISRLSKGSRLVFAPVPMPDIEPEDERTTEFREVLRQAKETDEAWIKGKAELGPRPRRREMSALERALRDRCREQLGMSPWKPVRSVKEQAELLGISTSYDLPAEPLPENGRHADGRLQTLFFPDEMEAKLAGIHGAATSLEKDAGIQALYAAFGFLEWYPARDSAEALHAPLLLWPVASSKDLVNQSYEYAVRGRDEDEAVNHSLIEKLKSEFGLVLPDIDLFESEETGAVDLNGWFTAVEEAVRARDPRWRVRNWVVMGLMTFHKIALWEDLDPAKWPGDADPRSNPTLCDIFGEGKPWDGRPAVDYDVDQVEAGENPPLLITDADSSQHSAIIDVKNGKNLVIQGPPGTGKSQTITNIIAAALHEGKSVLFVSEKMAALEVVKSRIDDAGLGDFCLEVHSDKASRATVLKSLKARLEMAPPLHDPNDVAQLRRKLAERKVELSSYVAKMNQKVGESGRTVHDIIWGHARTKWLLTSGPAGLRQVRIADPLSRDRLAIDELSGAARALDDTAAAMGEEAKPSRQPWRGVGRTDFSQFDVEDVAALAASLAVKLREAEEAIGSAGRKAGWRELPQSMGEVRLRLGRPDAWVAPNPAVGAALEGLLETEMRNAVIDLAGEVERRNQAIAALGDLGEVEALIAAGGPRLAEAAREAGSQGVATPDAARGAARASADHALRIEATIRGLARLAAVLGTKAHLTPEGAEVLLAALRLGFPDTGVRAHVRAELGKEGAKTALEEAQKLAQAVKAAFREIGEGADADGIAGATALRQGALDLRETGFFGRLFSGDYRAAKAAYRRMLPQPHKAGRVQMAAALDAAVEWRSCGEEFAAFVQAQTAIKDSVRGIDAPFEALIAAADWMERVRHKTPAIIEGALEIRRAVLEADSDAAQVLSAFLGSHGAALDALLEMGAATLEEGVRKLLERRAVLERLGHLIGEVGWRDSVELGRLDQAARLVSAAAAAEDKIVAAQGARAALGALWRGAATDPAVLIEAVEAAESMASWPVAPDILQRICSADDPSAAAADLLEAFAAVHAACATAFSGIRTFADATRLIVAEWAKAETIDGASFAHFAARCEAAAAKPEQLPRQCALLGAENQAREVGLGSILGVWVMADLPYAGLEKVVEAVWLHSAAEAIVKGDRTMAAHLGHVHESRRRSFQELDRKLLALNRQELAARLALRPVPAGSRAGARRHWTGRELIAHQCGLDRPSMHLRRLFERGGDAIRALKPCLMMSPMSVARYLTAGKHTFDLVVVDEASQMRPEDAAGAMLRAKQVVIVGDPKQLPPTSFFMAQGGSDDFDEDAQEVVEDSILELAMRAWKPYRTLKWHYRSRHQSLIAYSNARFYDGHLIVFPSDRDRGPTAGVHLEKIEGVYGGNRNEIEARAVVEAARRFMAEHPEKSLGIVAMNQKQQELISSLMDQLYADDPDAEGYRRYWSGELESTFVKNLENVQGDERDAMFISTVYGPDDRGAFVMRFGPINLANGHRRLNVLFTRAKETMTVFTSMDPAQIRVAPGSSEGVKVLKEYLDYARSGYVPVSPQEPPVPEPESEFERWFLERLAHHGYEAVPQVGVRGYRIDIGIRHPDKPGRFILGVECDGATYHSAKSARDRDRLRQTVLEQLGWTIHRVWSTDWFRNPELEFQALVRRVEELRAVAS